MARFKYLLYILLIMTTISVAAPDTYARKSQSKSKSSVTTKTGSKTGKKVQSKKTQTKKSNTKTKSSKPETSAEARKREKETQQEIARTKEQIRLNEQKVKRELKQLGKLQTDISAGEKVVAQTTLEVSQIDANINRLEKEINDNEAKLSSMRAEYLKAIKKVRAHKNSSSDMAFIFGAKNFRQALDRMRYLKRISKWRDQQSKEISAKVKTLSLDKDLLAQNRQLKDQTLQVQLSAQNQLKTQYAQQDAVVAGLKKNGSALKTHLSKKQAEANALKSRIAALIAEENRRAEEARKAKELDKSKVKSQESKDIDNSKVKSQESKAAGKSKVKSQESKAAGKSKVKSQESKGGGFASMKGSLPRPVNGEFKITSRFGKHALPDLPDVVYDNPGIDAQTAAGATAQAVYAGKVSGVYLLPGFSTVVIVNHGSYYTVYANIATSHVKVGQEVKQGTSLGTLTADEDNPGHSSIHFEVWHNREKLNPEGWIR